MSDDEIAPEPPAPLSDEELPPPPTDIAAASKDYPDINVKKSKPLATVRRAFIIFEKDVRTMAKHGLISAVILFIFLVIVFSIMSFSMKQATQFSFDQGSDGEGKGIPGASGVDPPTARAVVTPSGQLYRQWQNRLLRVERERRKSRFGPIRKDGSPSTLLGGFLPHPAHSCG